MKQLTVRQLTALLATATMLAPVGSAAGPKAPTQTVHTVRRAPVAAQVQAAVPGAATAAVEATVPGQNELTGADISVGFADSSSPTPNFPLPWQSAPNVVFIGGGSPWNAGAIRIDNPSSAPLAVQKVVVDLQRTGQTAGPVFDLWGTFIVPAQGSAILTQTATGNFNTSANPLVTCGQTLAANETRIPKITVTIGGAAQTFLDTTHILDTGGASCQGNKSLAWRRIGTTGIARTVAKLTLSPGSGSANGGTPYQLTAQLTDASDLPLRNAAVGFRILSGPNQGRTGQAITDSQGLARFSYAGGDQGTDVVEASVDNAGGSYVQRSNQVTVAWQSIACTPSTGSTGGGGGTTALSYVGALTAQTGDPLMLGALLLGANGLPLGGRSVIFTLGGAAQTAVTDATGVARLTVTAGIPSSPSLSVSYAGEPGQTSATVERSITIEREDSALRYTGSRLLGTGAVQTVSAVLRDADSQTPLAGRTVRFKLSTVEVTAVTDGNGVATATMSLPASVTSGPTSLQVSFAGDALYKPSTQGVALEVYLASSFVVWGGNTAGLKLGERVNFWGSQWDKQVKQGQYGGNKSFKGYADPVGQIAVCQPAATEQSLTPGCWESKSGNSFPPPIAIPNHIQVIVAKAIDNRGPDHIGNIAASAVVKVEPGYGTSPGKEGWGTIVALIFDTTVFPKPADLRVTQTQPAAVQPGQQVPIAVSITNASTQTGATGAVLTETLDGLTPGTATQTVGLVGTGATVVVPAINATVPAIPIRGGAETANDYIQRLFALNGRVYTATGQLQYSDGAGQIYAPIEASSSSTLQIPVLTVGLTGPDVVSPGGTIPFTVNIANIGGAAAASGTVGVQLPNGTSQTVTLGSIAAGATFTTVVSYTQTALAPRGVGETSAQYLARLTAAEGQSLSTQATLNWRDAAANNYGDVQARAFTSTVRVPVVSVTTQGLPATALPGQELTFNVTAANSGGCTASPVTVKVTNPDGTVTTLLPVFPLAAGQSKTLPVTYRVPVTASRDDAETEAQYLARLQATNNKALSFTAAANWSDPGGTAFGPSDVVSGITRETLPILTMSLTAPGSAPSGTTVNFGVAVTNSGLGASGLSSVVVTLPNLSVQTVAVPALAPGAAFSGVLPYAIPGTQPAGAMSISGVLVWADPGGNLYGPFSGGAGTTVTNPIVFNSLVLGPISSGPSIAGTTQTVTVTVKSGAGTPVANTAVTFTVTGANATTGTATTNAAGVATFTYSGAIAGVDTVTVTATDAGGTVSVSNPVPVNWVTPVASVSSTTVYGRFFPNPGDSGAFNTPNTEKPLFAQAFANVNFGDVNPFRNNITDQNGTVIGTIVAAGGGYVAGNDSLVHFQAVFTGQFNVTSAGNVVLNLSNDDGFILGVGPNASGQQPTRVAGEMVGAPAGGRTAFENFPVVGAYNFGTNAADHAVTVNFPAAGSYPYELDYAECCASNQTMKMGVKTGPVTRPLTPTGVLTVTPGSYSTFNVGSSTTLTVTALSASGLPVGDLPVRISVAGVNPKELTLTTDAAGTATFPVTGTVSGRDYAQAISTISGMAVFSNSAELQWGGLFNLYSKELPFDTPGNILAPANLSEVRGPVNVTYRPPFGIFGNSGVLEYYPSSNPADVRVIAGSVSVNVPGQVMGVFDPTGLPNGEYVIRFRSALISTVQVRVTGENKPGRMRASVKDFTVPLAGIPITIGRTYDSLERARVGDFGYGWDLSIAGPKLQVNSQADVTLTIGGRRMTFFMTPGSNGFPFPFWLTPGYTAERGTYGSLATVGGCPVVIQGANGRYLCFPETVTPYAPTSYIYTAPDGVKYEVGSDGKMISITDLSGNKLTFGANGITSTADGASVPFLRDGSGRITRITDTLGNNYNYSYNAAGELVNVQYPLLTQATLYEYSATGHFLTKETDPRGNSAQTTYTADGKLASVQTAAGHLTGFAYSYDAATRRTTTTQTNPDAGIETTITDVDGNVVERRDGLNRRSVFTYDTNNNMLTETNHLGETKTYTYDARGFRTSVRDALGKTSTVVYNVYGGPTAMSDQLATAGSPGGNTRTIAYDAQFRPATITDSLGQVAIVTYDAQGNIATLRDANNKLTSFTYNSRGDKLTQTDPLNRVRRWSYDLMGRVKTETDARNGVTEYTYDALGRKTEVKDALNPVTSKMEWDNEGNKTADVDQLGRRTTYAYDLDNRLRLTTYPDLSTMAATYDFRNMKLTETDQLSRVTKNEYDKAGQLTAMTKAFATPVAGTMGYGYDGAGRKTSETDERGNATAYEFDTAGRMTKMTNALGQATEYGYDLRDQRTSVKDANGRTMRYTFDARGRMTTTTYPDNTTMVYGFDGMGRQTSVKDQAGKVTQKGFDDAGQLTSVTDALTQITRYGYDPNGNLASQTDAATRLTSYQWDALNRRTRRTLPLLMFETYGYDAVGNMTSRVDFKGKTTGYGYDSLNRLVSKTPDTSFFSAPTQYSYHANGLRQTMTDPSGVTSYQYDARNRLTVKASPQGMLSYGYDAHDNVASMQSGNANGTWVEYGWDQLNRVASVVDRRLAVGTTTYDYNLVGNRLRTVYPNGVAHDFGYDTLDRLTTLPVTTANGTGTFAYTLEAAGHRTKATGLNGRTSTYGYDEIYRLISENIAADPTAANNGTIGYGYDPVGNRLSMTSTLGVIPGRAYTYDANDRLGGDTYDANGNTLTSGGYSYTYDYEDRLIQGNTVGFVYDGDGNRVRKTVGASVTRYLVDELNPTGYSQVVEEILNGSVQRTYTYGLQRISQDWAPPSPTAHFYVYDGHGSVRALTDIGGAVTDAYEYDAFGNLVAGSGNTANHNLYGGEHFDVDLGLYYLRARWYRPATGRFQTADKFDGTATGAELVVHLLLSKTPLTVLFYPHLYGFARANPVSYHDYSGFNIAERGINLQVVFKAGPTNHGLLHLEAKGLAMAQAEVEAFIEAAAKEFISKNAAAISVGVSFDVMFTMEVLSRVPWAFRVFMQTSILVRIGTYFPQTKP